jgi:hypothetical protein
VIKSAKYLLKQIVVAYTRSLQISQQRLDISPPACLHIHTSVSLLKDENEKR